jgi:hypothetical protein
MDEHTVFGPALLEAYSLESKTACDPRIVLSEDMLTLVRHHSSAYSDPSDSPQNWHVLVDADGVAFLNYLSDLLYSDGEQVCLDGDRLKKHRDHIQRNLHDQKAQSQIWSKYRWLADYHNHFCQQCLSVPGFDRDLFVEDSRLHRGPRMLFE